MAKAIIPIPRFSSWNDARNAISVGIQTVVSWVQSLPPKTDMHGSRVVNVANPVNPQDAVTLSFLNTAISSSTQGTSTSSTNPTVGNGKVTWKVGLTPFTYISATPGGVLNLNAGGTNQNINLTPTGTGGVVVTGAPGGNQGSNALIEANGMIRATNYSQPTAGAGLELMYVPAQGRGQINCYNRAAGTYNLLQLDGNPLILQISGGNVGITTSPNVAYRLDVNGPINCGGAGVFYCQGTAGQTVTLPYGKLTGTATPYTLTPGTLTYVGGILVGHS